VENAVILMAASISVASSDQIAYFGQSASELSLSDILLWLQIEKFTAGVVPEWLLIPFRTAFENWQQRNYSSLEDLAIFL